MINCDERGCYDLAEINLLVKPPRQASKNEFYCDSHSHKRKEYIKRHNGEIKILMEAKIAPTPQVR